MEELTACPVCTKTDNHPFIEITGYSEGKYWLCSCGAAFLSPRMDDAELDKWYRSGAYREKIEKGDAGLKDTKIQLADRAKYIAQIVKQPIQSHLDIGCSSGELVREIRSLHPDIYSAGVDSDPVLISGGFRLVSSMDEIGHLDTFDLITCIQTLEHINNPRKMVTDIYDHLNPGGTVIVEVPNRRACMFAFSPPQHVVAYDEKSLRSLFIGYKNVMTFYHGKPYQSPLDLSILLTATK